jgi:hypothetical protein
MLQKCVIPKPFTTHQMPWNDSINEELWRDGAKWTNRSRDMAVWVFGVPLTHETVQKNQNAAKTHHPIAAYNASQYSQGVFRCWMAKRWGQTNE